MLLLESIAQKKLTKKLQTKEKVLLEENQLLRENLQLEEQKNQECKQFIQLILKHLESKQHLIQESNQHFNQKSSQHSSQEKLLTSKEKDVQQSRQTNTNSTIEPNNIEDYQTILKERNQLFQISEDLYKQLKYCQEEKEDYLMQLREKQLSFQKVAEELIRFKTNSQQNQENQMVNNFRRHLQPQIEKNNQDFKKKSLCLAKQNEELKQNVRELERKVKESFKAIEQFKKQAFAAKSELIVRQSQINRKHISRQKPDQSKNYYKQTQKSKDNLEIMTNNKNIQALLHELKGRCKKYFDLKDFCKNTEIQIIPFCYESILSSLTKEVNTFYLIILKIIKNAKDKQTIMKAKILLLSNIEKMMSIKKYENCNF